MGFKAVARYFIQKENILKLVEWIRLLSLSRYRWEGHICRDLFVNSPSQVHSKSHSERGAPFICLSNAIRLFILKISKSCREIERVSILFYQQEMSNISFLNQKSKRYKKTGYRSLCLITITLRLLKRMHFTMCCFLKIETVCLILQRNDPAVFWLNTQRSDSWFHGLKSHHCCSGD